VKERSSLKERPAPHNLSTPSKRGPS